MPKLALFIMALFVSSTAAIADDHHIVGVGSTSQCAKNLFVRGCDAAVFESRVCKITGRFSTGSHCYAVLHMSDGSFETRSVSARDADAMDDFIHHTKTHCAFQFDLDGEECYDGLKRD